MKIFTFLIIVFFTYSCVTTSSSSVNKSDTQTVSRVEYGQIKATMPVNIKGEGNWVGGLAGAMIGALLGSQICGDKEIAGNRCQDIGVIYGAIGGAAVGTVVQAKLGDHNGFQYIIDIENEEEDKAFVQGDEKPLPDGQKVVIIYGDVVRILPFEG